MCKINSRAERNQGNVVYLVANMFSCADKCDGTSSGCNAVMRAGKDGGWGGMEGGREVERK